jgi:hypothetical protein
MRALSLVAVFLAVASIEAQTIDSATFGAIEARALGPAVTSGRVTSIDGVASDSKIVYVGAANGGVWKTTNGGTTFKPIFDKFTQSIGAITIDQSKPDTVWVGTGEAWVRNSTSVGTGIYKTKDAGDNWQFMGLPNCPNPSGSAKSSSIRRIPTLCMSQSWVPCGIRARIGACTRRPMAVRTGRKFCM